MICDTPPPESGFTKKCEAIDTSGYNSSHYRVFDTLAPYLGWMGLLAFIASMIFGVLVLVKNRPRKIAC
jgi:hypothetical protein